MSQTDTEIDKNPKFFNFQSFYAIFVIFPTESVDWKVEKGQQGKTELCSRLSEELNADFSNE